MNIKVLFFNTLTSMLLLSSCEEVTFGCEEGNGYKNTKYFNSSYFSELDIDIRAETFLTQGENYEVKIVASENIINKINVSVQARELQFNTSRGCVNETEGYIRIYITAPNFEKLTLNSSGSLTNESFLDLEDLSIYVNGSCDVDLNNIAVNDFDIHALGRGNVTLQGETADKGDVTISSSGDVNLSNLLTNSLNIQISGSGVARVLVNSSIDASLSGSGDLIYEGYPEVIKTTTGSGKVYQAL